MRGILLLSIAALLLTAPPTLPVLAASPGTAAASVAPAPAPAPAPTAEAQIVVFYFHGDRRCPTCMRIESATEQALRSRFGKELDEKRLEWRVVNFDKSENEHVIKDYGLVAQSVVLVEYRGGKQVRFKNLDKVWRLIHDDAAFDAYIRDEIRAFIDGAHA